MSELLHKQHQERHHKQHRVHLVDDDPVLQAFLEDYLSQQGYNISFSEDGEQLESLLQNTSIDLIILDILLPGKDGFHWLKWLHQNHPTIKIIMLSVKGQDDDRVQGLESGAHDYLVKPFHPRELLARINNLLKTPPTNNSSIHFGAFCLDFENRCLTKDKQAIKLTNTELVFLTCLCKQPDEVITRDNLSLALRGNTHHPLDRSIDVHINRLRGKIEEDPSSPQHIRTVWGKGYLFHAG
ncbi:MAG: response regulator [Thiotrichaceae bacterium]